MRNTSPLFPRSAELVVLATGLILTATGDPEAWAAPSGAQSYETAAVSAAPDARSTPTVRASPSQPRVSRAASNMPLIGTAVFEEGRSYALFARGDGYWPVEVGEELPDGGRLCEIRTDRIIVEHGGARQEISLFPVGVSASLSSTPATVAVPVAADEEDSGEAVEASSQRVQMVAARGEQVKAVRTEMAQRWMRPFGSVAAAKQKARAALGTKE